VTRAGTETLKAVMAELMVPGEVGLGLGRIVALYNRSSTSHQIHEHIWCLYL
jgi:hypothetical protein